MKVKQWRKETMSQNHQSTKQLVDADEEEAAAGGDEAS